MSQPRKPRVPPTTAKPKPVKTSILYVMAQTTIVDYDENGDPVGLPFTADPVNLGAPNVAHANLAAHIGYCAEFCKARGIERTAAPPES